MPGTKIQEHGGSDKAMVWSCVDFADESQRVGRRGHGLDGGEGWGGWGWEGPSFQERPPRVGGGLAAPATPNEPPALQQLSRAVPYIIAPTTPPSAGGDVLHTVRLCGARPAVPGGLP